MKMLKGKTWQHEITGSDGNVILFGINIFDYEVEFLIQHNIIALGIFRMIF